MGVYYCPFCINTFPDPRTLILHCKVKHYALINSRCTCQQDKCFRSFPNIYGFNKHLQSKHRLEETACQIPHNVDGGNILFDPDDAQIPVYLPNLDIENNCHCLNTGEYESLVTNCASVFAAKLYANNSVTRSLVQEIIEAVTEFISTTCIEAIKQKYNCTKCNDKKSDCNEMFDILAKPFQSLQTEYQRFKYFEASTYFIKPEPFPVGTLLNPATVNNTRRMDVINLYAQIVPMAQILKKFLELPNVFETIISYMDEVKTKNSLVSLVQGTVWRAIERKFENKVVLPLIVYFDEFEVNNPLGTHTGINKLGGVYYTIAALPSEYSGRLENIFLAQLHNAQDMAVFGNEQIFHKIIEQLTNLEKDGITININGNDMTVYFVLAALAGDNLGLHDILGFVTSFNANYACRICTAPKQVRQRQVLEDPEMLRTIENYAEHSASCTTGVKEPCIFNKIPSYHVAVNRYCDVMHDSLEGIFRYDMGKILNRAINIDRYFTLTTLNNRIRYFNYGSAFEGNIPPAISNDALKNECLILSASEMSTLVCYLGLIIGDLVPENSEVWKLFVILRQIHCNVMAPSHTIESINSLKTLISEHHRLWLLLFNEPLKPKHHFLLHYPGIIKKIGPLKNVSCMRFEANHRDFKNNAKVVYSRRNISHTLSTKQQLQLTYRLLANKGFEKRFTWGVCQGNIIRNLQNFETFQTVLPPGTLDDDRYLLVSWIQVNGTSYKPDMVISFGVENGLRQFWKIKYILMYEYRKVEFLLLKMDTIDFSNHLHAFQVEETETWNFLEQAALTNHIPYNVHCTADGKFYVPCD